MQLYSFTFGDTSYDGHEKTATEYIKCNRTPAQIKELFAKFSQKVGLSFDRDYEYPTIMRDYGVDYITKADLDKILAHATNKLSIIELFDCKYDMPKTPEVCRFNDVSLPDELEEAYNALPTTYKGEYRSWYAFDYKKGKYDDFASDDYDIKLVFSAGQEFFPLFVLECLKIVDPELEYEQAVNEVPELILGRIGYGLFE